MHAPTDTVANPGTVVLGFFFQVVGSESVFTSFCGSQLGLFSLLERTSPGSVGVVPFEVGQGHMLEPSSLSNLDMVKVNVIVKIWSWSWLRYSHGHGNDLVMVIVLAKI